MKMLTISRISEGCMALGATLTIMSIGSAVCTPEPNLILGIAGLVLVILSYEINERTGCNNVQERE